MTLKRGKAIARISALCAIIVGAVVFSTSCIFNKAEAISPSENEPTDAVNAVVQKIKVNGVLDCLSRMTRYSDSTINGYYSSGQNGDNTLRQGLIWRVYDTSASDAWDDENAVKVPFKIGSDYIADGGVSCEELLYGYDATFGSQVYNSIVPRSKIENVDSTDDMLAFMTGLGYTYTMDTSSVSKRGCFHLVIQTNDSPVDDVVFLDGWTGSSVNHREGYTNEVCFNLDNDNKVVSASTEGDYSTFSAFNMIYHTHCGFLDLGTCDDNHTVYEHVYFTGDGYSTIYPYAEFSGSPMSSWGPLGFNTDSLWDKDVMYYSTGGDDGGAMTWAQVKERANLWANGISGYTLTPDHMLGGVWLNLCRDGNNVYYDGTSAKCGSGGGMSSNGWSYVNAVITEPNDSDEAGQRVWTSGATDYSGALEYLTGMSLADAAYTDDDLYVLSHYLLSTIYNYKFHADASSTQCSHTSPLMTTIPVRIRSTGETRYCEMLTLSEAVGGTEGTDEDANDGKVHAISSVGDRTLTKMDAYGLLGVLNSLNVANVTDEHIVMIDDCSANPDADGCNGGGSGGGGTETPDPEEDECDPSIEANTKDVECQEKGCYKEAGSMGWIICPVIFGLHDFVDNIYDKHIAPLLSVDKGIVYDLAHMDNSSATYKGWAMFRNIANILFAIVLLVVVFSQVTGFGIDNYGVKKILPKLIVTAILVNLSYIICGVLVDISNMLGAGIKGLFEGAAGNITIAGVQSESAKMTGVILNGLLVLVAGGGIAAGAIAISSGAITGWSIVLPLLLIGLSAFLTVICALIVLGARQAIILILIVVSPFAFVCYALPNLNGVFKKWLKLFEAMLMVFPICGALVGGGYFASCIILGANSDGSILTLIISAIVCMVPYFLIPSVTGRAMNAVGGLAGRVMGMGRGVSNGIGNRARNSEAYKNRIKNSQDAARARAANRYLNSRRGRNDLNEVASGRGNALSRHRRQRLANALQNANSDYEVNKGILDSAQLRTNVASGHQTAVDDYGRAKGFLDLANQSQNIANQQLVDNYNRQQSTEDLAHTVGELGAMRSNAELKRRSEHWANEYANTNSSSDLRTQMNQLLSQDPTLQSADSKARFAAIMDRQKTVDPKGYADLARNIIDNGTVDAKQELKNHMRNNDDIASKFGLKQALKQDAGSMSTTAEMQDYQAAKDTKSLLAMDDDLIQSYAGLAGATGLSPEQSAIVQNMTRAADDIIANPKMAEGLESESLNTIARIASGDSSMDWNRYKQIAANDTINIGGQDFRRSKLPSTKDITGVSGRVITYKDGSTYNADTGELTLPPHNPNP